MLLAAHGGQQPLEVLTAWAACAQVRRNARVPFLRVTEARHCVVCQPHGPVIDVSCSCCGNGPLITGQPPELGAQLAAPALDWMHSRGWQLHPQPLCPADHR